LDNVANVLARTLADETALIVELFENSNKSEAAIQTIQSYARDKLRMDLQVQTTDVLPDIPPTSVVSVFDKRFNAFLTDALKKPFRVNSFAGNENVEIRVAVEPTKQFVFRVGTNRAQAVGTPLLLLFMALSTLLFMGIAVVFMRNQIKPILDLTAAAQQFGKGREISSFRPEGATEVRLAGEAFLDMKRRIARHVEQRTTLLAGVSHDLRTILTRFKLELAVLGGGAKTKPLHDDVNEMQHMLEDYMAFVRGDGGEQASELRVVELVNGVVDSLDRNRAKIILRQFPDMKIQLKANAFRRLLSNIVVNAMRFGSRIEISGEQRDARLWLYVDDDGPGILPHLRDDVFKPFTRLDEARNLDHSGSGLGLAIALDIAHAHGGDIVLEESKLGGLRVAVKVPV
jgi:two-component system, OmpR family, osmolarity sensor histidine kinase EnvZ